MKNKIVCFHLLKNNKGGLSNFCIDNNHIKDTYEFSQLTEHYTEEGILIYKPINIDHILLTIELADEGIGSIFLSEERGKVYC